MGHPSARELLDSCARSPETAAWRDLVHRFGPAIEAGVRRALRKYGADDRDPDAVRDLVQECYCRLLDRGARRLHSFRGSSEPQARTWLRLLAERTARDRLRAERAAKRGPGRLAPVPGTPRASLADPLASPERRALSRERLRNLTRGWRRLAGGEREAGILRLVFVGGLTSREVAEATGGALTPSSVDSVVYRFRRRLEAEGLPLPHRP
jgi:RNA polymerase sigma factor (sigma-70 family)